eukprot:1161644-Pelagomonas_calceolata.AAC.1
MQAGKQQAYVAMPTRSYQHRLIAMQAAKQGREEVGVVCWMGAGKILPAAALADERACRDTCGRFVPLEREYA